MSKDYDIGRAAAQNGWRAPPPADNYINQQQRNAGWNHERYAPRPQPQPLPQTKDSKGR